MTVKCTSQADTPETVDSFPNVRSSFWLAYSVSAGVRSILSPVRVIGTLTVIWRPLFTLVFLVEGLVIGAKASDVASADRMIRDDVRMFVLYLLYCGFESEAFVVSADVWIISLIAPYCFCFMVSLLFWVSL